MSPEDGLDLIADQNRFIPMLDPADDQTAPETSDQLLKRFRVGNDRAPRPMKDTKLKALIPRDFIELGGAEVGA